MTVDWKTLLPNDPSPNDVEDAKALARDMESWSTERYGDDPTPAPAPAPLPTPAERDLETELSDARLRSEGFAAKVKKIKADRGEYSESYKRMSQEYEDIKNQEFALQTALEEKTVRDAAWEHSRQRARAQVEKEAKAEAEGLAKAIEASGFQRGSDAHAWMTERMKERKLSPEQVNERVEARAAEIVARIEAGPPPEVIKEFDTVDPHDGAKDAYIAEQIRLGVSETEAAAKAAAIERGHSDNRERSIRRG